MSGFLVGSSGGGGGGAPTGPAGGDLSGTYPNPSIASGVIVDGDVNASAAIAGTKISPNFGAQTVATTGNLTLGATLPTTGTIRLANASTIVARNAADNLDIPIITHSNLTIDFGSNTTNTTANVRAGGTVRLQAAGGYGVEALAASGLVAISAASAAGITFCKDNLGQDAFVILPNQTGTTNLRFSIGVTAAQIIQVDNTTNSATAAPMTINAQNATGTTATGGALNLVSGTGTTAAGNILLKSGATTKLTITPSLTTSVNDLAFGATPATAGTIRLPDGAIVTSRNTANTQNIPLFTVADNLLTIGNVSGILLDRIQNFTNSSIISRTTTHYFQPTNGSVSWLQLDSTGLLFDPTTPIKMGTNPSTTGNIRLANASSIKARNAANSADIPVIAQSDTTVTVGDSVALASLSLQSGVNLINRAGSFFVQNAAGNTDFAVITSTLLDLNVPTQSWRTAVTAPTVKQADNVTNSATAQPLTLQAQNATGTTATGGALNLQSGTGTTAAGNVVIKSGATTKITVSPTDVTFVDPLLFPLNSTASVRFGTNPGSDGYLRFPNAISGNIMSLRNVGNTNDLSLMATTTSNLYLGTDPVFTTAKQVSNISIYAAPGAGTIAMGLGGTTYFYLNAISVAIEHWKPISGSQSANVPLVFSSSTITFASADITMTSAQYCNRNLILTGTTGGARDLIGPTTANGEFVVRNTTADIITIKKAAGTGVPIAAGRTATVRYDATAAEYVRVHADSFQDNLDFPFAAVAPTIKQLDDATNSVTGDALTIQAQNATGTTAIGGALSLKSGTGTSVYGQVNIVGNMNGGVFTQAMADANQTVSAANSINNLIITTGTVTTPKALTLTSPPTAGTMKFVRNNCTGSITVQFSSGAATAAIATNTSALVYGDGTNAVILMSGT